MATTFYLIRHGDTAAIDRYLAGRAAGTALTDEGRAQVGRLVDAMRRVPLTVVAASPLERTQQTARPLAADHGLDVTIVPELNEVEFGDWTGAAFAALVGDERWRRYNAVRSLTSPPNGELMLQVQARAVKTILDLRLAQVDGHVAVVSHGDVIRALLMYFLGVPLDFVHRLDVAPARISVVVLSDEGVRVPQVNGDTVP